MHLGNNSCIFGFGSHDKATVELWDGISRLYIFPEHQKYLIFCVSFVISFRRCVNVGESAILNFGKRLFPSEKLSEFLRRELG